MPSFLKVTVLFVTLMITNQAANAGLDEEMGLLFGDMINSSAGGFYETQRRGILTGGNLTSRNKIVHPNLISFVPPGIKAGCGGIDIFAGSFSFINSEQLTQLARSVAQASVGYAFHLAIEGMCPTCSQVMQKLEKDVQYMNGLMKNSCEFGKLIVDNTVAPALESINHKAKDTFSSKLSTETGFISDFFAAKETKNKSQAGQLIDAGKGPEISTNVVYKSLLGSNTKDWFRKGGSEMNNVMMSLTGTYIIVPKSDNTDIQYNYYPPIISTRDFIEGGSLTIYRCESDACLLPDGNNKQTLQVTGMRARVQKMLFGSGACSTCSGGIVRKMSNRDGQESYDAEETLFLQVSTPGVAGLLHDLADEPGAMAMIAQRMTDVVATELTNQIVDESYETVMQAVAGRNENLDNKILDAMRIKREQISQERQRNANDLAGLSHLLATYKVTLTNLHQHSPYKNTQGVN